MPRTEILPNGRAVIVPDDMTREEALGITGFASVSAARPAAIPTKSDIVDDAQRGIGGLMVGIGSAIQDAYEPAGLWLQNYGKQVINNNPADYGSIDDVKDLGDLFSFGVERIAETAPQLLAAGAVSLVGTPVAGASFLAGTTGLSTYGGARQVQRETGETNYTKALLAGVGAGALDVLGVGKVLPGAGKLLGEVFEGGLKGAVKSGAKIGAEESLTETGQNVLERFGGGQDLTSREALKDYAFSALSGALVGAPLGAARGAFGSSEAQDTEGPVPPQAQFPTGPIVPPSNAPEGIVGAPAISTVDILRPDEAGDMNPVTISILSEPDEYGNVWVRSADGAVSQIPQSILIRMGGESVSIKPPFEEPPFEEPAAGVSTVGEPTAGVPTVGEPTAGVPTVGEPTAGVSTVGEPTAGVSTVGEPTAGVSTVGEPTAGVPTVGVPTVEIPTAGEPTAGVPTVEGFPVEMPPTGTPPFTPPVGGTSIGTPPIIPPPIDVTDVGAPPVKIPPTGGESVNEPGEQIPPEAADEAFTQEEGELARTSNANLANALRGQSPIGAASYLANNAKSAYIRNLNKNVAGMMNTLQKMGYRFSFNMVSPATKSADPKLAKTISNFKRQKGVLGQVSTSGMGGIGMNMSDILLRDINYPNAQSGANEATATHEFIHAVSAGLIAQYQKGRIDKNSRVGKAVGDLIALQSQAKKYFNGVMNGTIAVNPKTKETISSLQETNAFQNVHELLTYGLTDWRMQFLLKQIEVKKVNGFTAFIRSIGKMLGLSEKDTNGLRKLIEITEEIIPESPAKQLRNARLTMYGETTAAPTLPSEQGGDTVITQEEPGVAATAIGEESPIDTAGQVDSGLDVVTNTSREEGVKFSSDAAQAAPSGPSGAVNKQGRAYVQVSLGDEKRMDRYRRFWADKMRRLGFIEEAIEKATGHSLPRYARPSETASLFEPRANERLDALQRDHLNKILDLMKREGITPNEADMFLLARTAFDRNAKIAKRNPAVPDGGSGLTNAEASIILSEFVTSGRMGKMVKLAAEVDALTAKTRETMVKYEMLTQEEADRLVREEPFYVPLKGLAEGEDMSVSGDNANRAPNSGRGFSISRKDFLVAKGRSSLPFSPLANAMADAQTAIVRGERNRVGQSFLNDIVRKYDSNAWQAFTDETPDMEQIYNSKTKKVESRPVQMDRFPETYFIVKDKNKTFYIKIADPLLMRALTNGSSKDFAAVNKFLGSTIGLVTRALSRLHTTLNPEFFVPNFVRDVEAAVFNILAEQDAVDGRLAGKQIITDVLKDVKSIKNFRMLFRATFNRKASTAEQRALNAMFQQAKEDGAFTGWIMRETPEEHMEKIKSDLERATATGKEKVWYSTQEKAKSVFEKIQDFNSVFENVTRFAVYKAAIKAGVTRDEAANMSRNVTVDFNKKGEASPVANSLYAFFNAAVRGNAQLLRSLTAKTADGKYTRAQKLAVGMVAFGVLQTAIGRGMSDEDDDGKLFYDKIPDWEKQRNIIIMMPNGEDYIKIPLPYGYSFFHNFGTLGAETAAGTKTVGDMGVGILSGLLNNFSPVPITGSSIKGITVSTVPTALRPFADLLINENYFGSPIYNKPFDENQALSSVSRYSTPEGYKTVVQFLNEATGGYGKIAGKVDAPAESIKYLVDSYIGGAGKFGTDLISGAVGLAKGDDIEIRKIPIVRKVVGELTTQNDLGMYYDRLNEIQPIGRQYRDSTGQERAMLRDKYPVETNPRVVGAMKQAQSNIKAVNKIKTSLLNRDMDYDEQQTRLDRLNERQADIYTRFNRTYNQVEEAQSRYKNGGVIRSYQNGGAVRPGNIDLHKRPVVKNKDGSISTVRSRSFGFDEGEVLLPTVSDNGRIMTDDEAVEQYRKTGRHLGIFKTPQDANAYAIRLHNEQEKEYVE